MARKFAVYATQARSNATRAHYKFVSAYARQINKGLSKGWTIRASGPKNFEDYFSSYEKMIANETWPGHHYLWAVWESRDKTLARLWRECVLDAKPPRPASRGHTDHFGEFRKGKPGRKKTVWDELRKRLSQSYREENDKLYGGFGGVYPEDA